KTLASYLDADLSDSGVILGEHILLKDSEGALIRRIPIDSEGNLLIRFQKDPPLKKEVEFYSVILASEQRRNQFTSFFDLGLFRNSLVFVGREHPNTMEAIHTPLGLKSPARIQIQALSNLLNETYLIQVKPPIMAILIICLGACGMALGRLDSFLFSLGSISVFAIYVVSMICLTFYLSNWWAEPSALIATPLLTWLASRTLLPYFDYQAERTTSST
ncbi:MAG: CHASE2 domain-containing protein, partial [Verrucomicrobiota bacterium]